MTTSLQTFSPAELALRQATCGSPYLEFLRSDALSAGIYVLPEGGTDDQQPHTEDEVYVVVRGRAHLTVDAETTEVEPGSIVFVPAGAVHRFHDIAEELHTLVLFAPPEGLAGGARA